MKRIKITPRINYQQKIENLGFNFHTDYWKEQAYYSFSNEEIESIETATNECYIMYCQAVQKIMDEIEENDYTHIDALKIPRELAKIIKSSWDMDDLSLYGRFDFAFINGVPKLLEFNADTPTSLLEASIIQWDWKKDCFPNKDQFNVIHEFLVQSWKDFHVQYKSNLYYFAYSTENIEDKETVQYIISTAMEAGLNCVMLDLSQLKYDENVFTDPNGNIVECCRFCQKCFQILLIY